MNLKKIQNGYKHYDFQILWKFVPLRRSLKEELKHILFGLFPFFFRRWVIYNNWKHALIYKNRSLHPLKTEFWNRKFNHSYPIPVSQGAPAGNPPVRFKKLAVVIHVFYPEIFREMIRMLDDHHATEISLYITGPACQEDKIKWMVPDSLGPVNYMPVENRGRDILPFLRILPQVFADGHELVLKLHTKGSNHLNRKEQWRNDLFSKLIAPGQIDKMVDIFNQNKKVGMVGPSGNILAMRYYYGSNAQIVGVLSRSMGVEASRLQDLNFVAGTMFYARKEALLPVLKLNLAEENFEKEAGQKDGTLAHAVERLFAVGLIVAGLQLADTNYDDARPVLTVNKNHYFSS